MEKQGSLEPAQPLVGSEPITGVSVAKPAGVVGEDATRTTSNKLFRSACMRRWLPLVYREELYHVLKLTGPLLLFRILNFLLPFVNTIFAGHIGNSALAGYALGSATITLTTIATGYGLAVACDTLISQTYGAKNLKRVGVILQRSSLILLLFCLPCWAILINSHRLLILLHQEDEVARIAQIYVMAYIPAVPAMFLHQLQVAYLQNQGIILPQMYTAAAANIINLGVNYVLITSLELGVTGSAIASSLSQIIICLLLFGYIRWRKLYKQTWDGWSIDCLQEWGSYMKLAIPGLFMVCFEWWIWDIGGFLAGILGENDLAAQHILLEIGAITYMIPLGIQAATCVRVGNALGAGNTSRAITTCKVTLILSGVLAVIQSIAIAGCKSFAAYIFTSDIGIVKMVSENLTVYIFLQFFDSLLCVSSGILVGCGMQKIAAAAHLVCYYCVSLPVGVLLMFFAELRIMASTNSIGLLLICVAVSKQPTGELLPPTGFWLGLLVCVFLELVFFFGLIYKLNWKKVTVKAQQRAGKKLVATPMRPSSTILNEAMLSDMPDIPDTAQLSNEEAQKTDGYSQVETQDQQLKSGHEAEVRNANTGKPDGDAEKNKKMSNAKSEVPLSISQLVLRRGLVVLVLLLILLAGVAFHIAFPPPEPSAKSRANFTQNWANNSFPTIVPLNMTFNL